MRGLWADGRGGGGGKHPGRDLSGAGWDLDLLKLELAELAVLDVDLTATGFSTGEIDVVLKGAPDPDDEVIPALPKTPRTRAGVKSRPRHLTALVVSGGGRRQGTEPGCTSFTGNLPPACRRH